MVKTYIAPDAKAVACPSCGEEFKVPPSTRGRRVSCPKCREAVPLENLPELATTKKERAPVAPDADKECDRNEALESRVAALEAAVAALIVARSGTERIDGAKKLRWAATAADDPLHAFSPERESALAQNLGTAKAREITFRISAGDRTAAERAGRLMEIFARAGWKVRGPEESAPHSASKSLVLGVPELPVGKEAAETYLALKAAGFEPIPVLDPALVDVDGVASLSLTLPAAIRA